MAARREAGKEVSQGLRGPIEQESTVNPGKGLSREPGIRISFGLRFSAFGFPLPAARLLACQSPALWVVSGDVKTVSFSFGFGCVRAALRVGRYHTVEG